MVSPQFPVHVGVGWEELLAGWVAGPEHSVITFLEWFLRSSLYMWGWEELLAGWVAGPALNYLQLILCVRVISNQHVFSGNHWQRCIVTNRASCCWCYGVIFLPKGACPACPTSMDYFGGPTNSMLYLTGLGGILRL
jgi:hypothetical protein